MQKIDVSRATIHHGKSRSFADDLIHSSSSILLFVFYFFFVNSYLHPHSRLLSSGSSNRYCIQRETWCMGPYAGVDCNLTLCRLQSRLSTCTKGQPCARVDLNPMPESTFSPSQGLRIWHQASFCVAGTDFTPPSPH